MWNNSHWKLTGNWQKDSCTTKALRKIHTQLSRRGRKVIWLGSVPLGGDSEERGDCTGVYPHWGVSGSSHRLGIPVLGSYAEETSHLGWLEDCWDGQKGWRSLDSAPEGCKCPGLPLRQGRERSALLAARFPMAASPCTWAQAKPMFQPHVDHATAQHWIWGATTREKTRPWAASEKSRWCLHRQCIGPLYAHGPQLLQHTPPLVQRFWCGEREKCVLNGNIASWRKNQIQCCEAIALCFLLRVL